LTPAAAADADTPSMPIFSPMRFTLSLMPRDSPDYFRYFASSFSSDTPILMPLSFHDTLDIRHLHDTISSRRHSSVYAITITFDG
jgi:hypothetical protein